MDKKLDKQAKETEKSKKKETKYLIYTLVIIIAIILIFVFSFRFFSEKNQNSYTYNGFDFVKTSDNMYQTKIQIRGQEENLYTLEFRYGPRDLEDIPVIGEPKYFLNANSMYIAFDPNEYNLSDVGLATADIQMNLVRVLNKKMVAACTNNESIDCKDVPIKNCENTQAPIIIVRHDPVTLIEQNGNCLIVQGKGMDVTKAANRLIYYLYGIMK